VRAAGTFNVSASNSRRGQFDPGAPLALQVEHEPVAAGVGGPTPPYGAPMSAPDARAAAAYALPAVEAADGAPLPRTVRLTPPRPATGSGTIARLLQRVRRPGVLALACVAILGVSFTVSAQFDPDFWWHVLVGDRILGGNFPRSDPFSCTAAGHAFIAQEWGSEVLYSLLLRLGMWAVICIMAAVTIVGLSVTLRRASHFTRSPAVLAFVGALSLAVAFSTFGPRSQMFTFTFCAVLLAILDQHRRVGGRVVWWCVPLFCLWGNLHGGFSIGLGLYVVVMGAEVIERRARPGRSSSPSRSKVLAAVFVASLVAIGVNPNGYSLLVYAGGLLANPVAQANLDEWRSPSFHDPTFLPLALLIVLLVVAGSKARRVPLADVLLAAAGLVLTLYAVRNLSILVVLAAPLLTDGLDGWATELGLLRRRARPLAVPFCALALAAVTAVSATVIAQHLTDPLNDSRSAAYPVAVAGALCAAPPSTVLEPYGSAGWLLFEMARDAPRPCTNHQVFIWGDVNAVGPYVFQAYLDAVAARPDALAILDSERVQTVWQARGDALPSLLQRTSGWTCVFGAGGQVIYTRSGLAAGWHADRTGCP
jgi:hypothetical protein